MRKIKYIVIVGMCCSLALLSGCHSGQTAKKASVAKEQAVQTAVPQTMTIYDLSEGKIEVPYLPDYPQNDYDWNCLFEKNGYQYYKDKKYGMSKLGIDVSKYQANVDWPKVKAAGIDFAMIRVGFRGYGSGKLVLDSKFDQNMKGAIDAGLNVGVYFFSQATSKEEGEEEARYVCEHCKDYNLTYPVVLDTEIVKDETSRTKNLTTEQRTDAASAFRKEIRKQGYSFMIYANAKWLTTCMDLTRMKNWDIWYADYQKKPQLPYAFQMWQYTESGTVPGVIGKVDLNVYWEK